MKYPSIAVAMEIPKYDVKTTSKDLVALEGKVTVTVFVVTESGWSVRMKVGVPEKS